MQIRQFELFEDLRPEGTAKAVLLTWNGKEYVRTGEEIELHEFVGTHGNRRDRGYCFLSPESKRWEALSGIYEQISVRGAIH